jgi:flavodoxin II
MSSPIGLFYASTTGNTEMVAEQLAALLPERIHLHDIAAEGVAAMAEYPLLMMGIPTWDFGELQEDWDEHWPDLQTLDFSGKRVALFGLGDQLGYGFWMRWVRSTKCCRLPVPRWLCPGPLTGIASRHPGR